MTRNVATIYGCANNRVSCVHICPGSGNAGPAGGFCIFTGSIFTDRYNPLAAAWQPMTNKEVFGEYFFIKASGNAAFFQKGGAQKL
ncbi:hypothetical protein [Komagataeibacter diospyri]|uniref:hypothetical protein n=1 Tax=Komagataeibacter diospyri TaxID=1932662 RepID=UPI001144077C|nr:hypothetical protein [Komagataeibacter diospyri]